MTTPEARVRQLIAKALDGATPLEEARSCALIAVKMIDEHKMLAVRVSRPPPRPRAAPERPVGGAWWNQPNAPPDWSDYFERRRSRSAPAEPKPAWWELLPTELWLFAERRCTVCSEICAEGSRVWAIGLEPMQRGDRLPRVKVCHMKCRDELPAEQRRRRGG
jgi:hypothetical protein